MNDELALKLLAIDAGHTAKVIAVKQAVNCDYFLIDLLDLVLTEMGVPEDNTVEMIARYGRQEAMGMPGFYCRDAIYACWLNSKDKDGDRRAFLAMVHEGAARAAGDSVGFVVIDRRTGGPS